MQWLKLAAGLGILILLYEKFPKIGGYLLIILVLGGLLVAQRKGYI